MRREERREEESVTSLIDRGERVVAQKGETICRSRSFFFSLANVQTFTVASLCVEESKGQEERRGEREKREKKGITTFHSCNFDELNFPRRA